jgi:GNAT superfamily N-acetyltransferase
METETKPIVRVCQLDSECWQFRAQREDGEVMASISLRCLFECPCVGIMYHLTTLEPYRRQGLAELLEREVEEFARRKAIGLLISTVRKYNAPCRALKNKLGYVADCEWNNPRTGNDLMLYRKVLNLSHDAIAD